MLVLLCVFCTVYYKFHVIAFCRVLCVLCCVYVSVYYALSCTLIFMLVRDCVLKSSRVSVYHVKYASVQNCTVVYTYTSTLFCNYTYYMQSRGNIKLEKNIDTEHIHARVIYTKMSQVS